MRGKRSVVVFALVILLVVSTGAFGEVTTPGQQGAMEQQKTGEVVGDQLQDREQARDQLKSQLDVPDQIRETAQDRIRLQDPEAPCFRDVEQHWARYEVEGAHHWGLIGGYPDGSFKPSETIRGIEATLMISRMLRLMAGEALDPMDPARVNWDEIPVWARGALNTPEALTLMHQSQFYGESQLNRLQFATMLARGLGLEEPEQARFVFTDEDRIPPEDLGVIRALHRLGVVGGDGEAFDPHRKVTRAEAAAMLMRVVRMIDE